MIWNLLSFFPFIFIVGQCGIGSLIAGMPIMEKDETEGGDAFAYYFWAIAIFFFTLALLNFIVLLVIAHVLEISPSGMEAIEFMPGQGSVKFLKHLIAPVTTIGSGLISGFAKEPMNIVAENGDIVFQVRLISFYSFQRQKIFLN